MSKLTNTLRDQIQRSLLTHVFKKRVEELITKHAEFAAKVYDDFYTAEERRKMNALPEGWLRTDDDFKVVFGELSSSYRHLSFNGLFHADGLSGISYTKPERVYRRFLSAGWDYPKKKYESNHPLSKEVYELQDLVKDLEAEIKERRETCRGILYSCTTANSLVKAWPEIRPFIPEYCFQKQDSRVIALPLEKLNKNFNLPKEETNESL